MIASSKQFPKAAHRAFAHGSQELGGLEDGGVIEVMEGVPFVPGGLVEPVQVLRLPGPPGSLGPVPPPGFHPPPPFPQFGQLTVTLVPPHELWFAQLPLPRT